MDANASQVENYCSQKKTQKATKHIARKHHVQKKSTNIYKRR